MGDHRHEFHFDSSNRPGGPRGHGRGPWSEFTDGPRGWQVGGDVPPWVHGLVRAFGGSDFARAFGPGPGGPGGHGVWGQPRGGRSGRGGRGRARRGDVRTAILDVLAGDEMNGYQVIQEIAERTNGIWKPSPGSVYPTIQQLEDEGLIEGREVDGRRLLRLTDEGRSWVENHPADMAATWAAFEPEPEPVVPPQADRPRDELMPVVGQVMGAMWQVVTTGTDQQRAEAAEILTDTRRRLYLLLAEGEPEQG